MLTIGSVPERLAHKAGQITPTEKRELDKVTLHTIKILLHEQSLNRSVIEQITAVYEHRIDFNRTLRNPASCDERGLAPQRSAVSLFGRILAITHVFDALTSPRSWREALPPQQALQMMFGEMRPKFDPFLIRIFVKAMAFVPTKQMEEGGSTISVT